MGFPGGASAGDANRLGFDPEVEKIPWRRS